VINSREEMPNWKGGESFMDVRCADPAYARSQSNATTSSRRDASN
jgi:hypothetical protein